MLVRPLSTVDNTRDYARVSHSIDSRLTKTSNSEKMVKIGAYLRKLSKIKTWVSLFGPLCKQYSTRCMRTRSCSCRCCSSCFYHHFAVAVTLCINDNNDKVTKSC